MSEKTAPQPGYAPGYPPQAYNGSHPGSPQPQPGYVQQPVYQQGYAEQQPVPQNGMQAQPQPQAVPGDASAPRGNATGTWNNSFFDCFNPVETCLCGWCLPCFLFGKTQARMRDPSLQNFNYCNGSCCGWCCLAYCGFSWILQCLKRGDMRDRYGIQGSSVEDCLGAMCCPCCGLVQEEKESLIRIQEAPAQGYQMNPAMHHP